MPHRFHPAMRWAIDDVPESKRLEMEKRHAWIAQLVVGNGEQRREFVRQRLVVGCDPENLPLLEIFNKYSPVAVIEWKGDWWAECERIGMFQELRTIFLPEPVSKEQVEVVTARNVNSKILAMSDFLMRCGGLRDTEPPVDGHFHDVSTFGAQFDPRSIGWEIENEEDWLGSLYVFTGRNGDVMIQRSDGAVGWWAAGELVIRPFAETYSEWIHHLCHHFVYTLRESRQPGEVTDYPLDSSGGPLRGHPDGRVTRHSW